MRKKRKKNNFSIPRFIARKRMTEKMLIQTAAHYSLETCLQKQQNCDVTIHGQEFKELDE